jgi:hypothetical protein
MKIQESFSTSRGKLYGLFPMVPLSITGAVPIMEGVIAAYRTRNGQENLLSLGSFVFEVLVFLLVSFKLSGPQE